MSEIISHSNRNNSIDCFSKLWSFIFDETLSIIQSLFLQLQRIRSNEIRINKECGRREQQAVGLQPHHVQQPDGAGHKHQNCSRRFRQPQKDLLPSLRSSQSVVGTLSSVDGSKFDGRTTTQREFNWHSDARFSSLGKVRTISTFADRSRRLRRRFVASDVESVAASRQWPGADDVATWTLKHWRRVHSDGGGKQTSPESVERPDLDSLLFSVAQPSR